MKLEKYLAVGKPKHSFDSTVNNGIISTVDLFGQLDEQIPKNPSEKEKADYAHSFVKTISDNLAEIAIEHAENKGIRSIGMSGGVTYNIPITNMVAEKVKKSGLKLIIHNRIPNGDGGISIGQNVIVGNKL
jgi:hydrogenase maturation protein HypF